MVSILPSSLPKEKKLKWGSRPSDTQSLYLNLPLLPGRDPKKGGSQPSDSEIKDQR